MTAYSYLFGAMLMALTGLFGANDVSDWMLTRPELLSVLYAVSCDEVLEMKTFILCVFFLLGLVV